MVRDLSVKDDARVFHEGVVRYTVAPDLVAVCDQFLDRLLLETAADIVPEINGSLELLDIIVPQADG